MKKIIKPAEREEAIYYSDFRGECFGEFSPPVELRIDFNYGSKYDGATIGLHLTDDEIELFLDIIKKNASVDYKTFLQKRLEMYENDYQVSCERRDWDSCDSIGDSVNLLRKLLDVKDD